MEGKATKLGGHDIAERKLCLPLLLERNRADELSARLLHAVHRTRLRRCKGGGGDVCVCAGGSHLQTVEPCGMCSPGVKGRVGSFAYFPERM